MKQQFIREEHNRQDKARSEPYRHSMLEYGTGSTGKTEWDPLARLRFSKGSVRFDTKSLGARIERRTRFHCAIFTELEVQHFQIQKFVISVTMKLPEFERLNRLPPKTAAATFRRVRKELEERMSMMKRRIQRTEIRCEELTDPRSGEVSESWSIDFDLTGLLQPVEENLSETKAASPG